MAFARGYKNILASNSCEACREGTHSECEYIREMESINHWVPPDETAGNMIYLRPWCPCYQMNEERHWDYEMDESRREYMEPVENEPKVKPRSWATWEAHFRIYPALIKKMGFDAILTRVSDELEEGLTKLEAKYGDVMLSGHFDTVISFCVAEHNLDLRAEFELDGGGWVSQTPLTMEDFQSDVGEFVAGLGLGGYVLIQRAFNVDQDGDDDA